MTGDNAPEFTDITDTVQTFLAESGIIDGMVLVFAQHTTAAIVIQEPEDLLKDDLCCFLDEKAPKEVSKYKHSLAPDHLKDGKPNAHSHCQHLMLGASETIPITGGKMMLGTYQHIFLVELDRARERRVVLQVFGE